MDDELVSAIDALLYVVSRDRLLVFGQGPRIRVGTRELRFATFLQLFELGLPVCLARLKMLDLGGQCGLITEPVAGLVFLLVIDPEHLRIGFQITLDPLAFLG